MLKNNYVALLTVLAAAFMLVGAGCTPSSLPLGENENSGVMEKKGEDTTRENTNSASAGMPIVGEETSEKEVATENTKNTAIMEKKQEGTLMENTDGTPANGAATEKKEGDSAMVETNRKAITVTAKNFAFSQGEIRVKKGDTVKITLVNEQGFHDWVVDALNVRTPQIGEGKTATVEFLASKIGTFEYYCSVGSHRALGMKGNLVVE